MPPKKKKSQPKSKTKKKTVASKATAGPTKIESKSPVPSEASSEKLRYVAIDDEIKKLALELHELGTQITNVAQQSNLDFPYLTMTLIDEAAADSLRTAYLPFQELRFKFSRTKQFPLTSAEMEWMYGISTDMSQYYGLLWNNNSRSYLGRGQGPFSIDSGVCADSDKRTIAQSEYRLDPDDFRDFPSFVRKFCKQADPLSKYLCTVNYREILQKIPGNSKARKQNIECQDVIYIINAILEKYWFLEFSDDECEKPMLYGQRLSPYIRSLRAIVSTSLDVARLNRAHLVDTYPGVIANIRNRGVTIDLDGYLPPEFWLIIEDISETRGKFYPIAEALVRFVKLFLNVFPQSCITRIVPCPAKIALDNSELEFLGLKREDLEAAADLAGIEVKKSARAIYEHFKVGELLSLIQDAHEKMVEFMRLITKAVIERPPVEITVSGDSTDLTLKKGGILIELQSASKRAMVCLALLRDKDWFHVNEFSELFTGKKPNKVEGARNFDRAFRNLKMAIPGLDYEDEYPGNRRLINCTLKVALSHSELMSALHRMRGGIF